MGPDLTITYPAELPITERRDELLAAIEANQVLVVAGETGSGKSTQLPKMCLELGRGAERLIGHTQPRRLAARTIAERVADELETTVGGVVGYTVRFNDQVGPDTRIRLMTDGILLAEIPRNRNLDRYDTIIIDEAHERSLNIDFILGYLRQLLPRRPDLKLIITSATIDTERFAAHFDDAPVIEVSGRTYPVEIRYEPLDDADGGDPVDQADGIADAVRRLWREDRGDVLVFCSGEREIRDAAEAVADLDLPGTEILPLYARLSAAEQHRVFAAHDRRRVVIATNVAETSVTVPGIRSVIDVGTARISRYSNRTKVQRLPIEDISQASADQRAGRCGRIGPGICVRLYSEASYLARPEFTEPEIQRTNLASVILQMASLGLGDVARFPFVDPPSPRSIADGIDLLTELDALDPTQEGTRRWLTPLGRQLAKLPVDPRYGRMLIEADENDCLDDVAVIVAGLSIQDPRERPVDKRQQADDAHRRFADPDSDFVAYLHLWEYLTTARRQRSHSGFRRLCRREFLNYHRVVEWQDIHTQLRQVARELGLRTRRRGRPRPDRLDDTSYRHALHRSILAGLLSHVGVRDSRSDDGDRKRGGGDKGRRRRSRPEYLGARSTRFAIAPGSSLMNDSPKWVMASELVETNRLWARVVAGVDPAWIEALAEHVATYSYSEPWWDRDRGSALVTERVTLYGLTLAANRRIQLSTVDPPLAREMFIHHALVEGDWDGDHAFVTHNQSVIADIEAMEARSRRRDLLVEARAIAAFYDARLPPDVAGVADFERWWRDERGRHPHLLDLTPEVVLAPDAGDIDSLAFPDSWLHEGLDLELAYEFDPSSPLDGVSVLVPVEVLNRLDPAPFEWTVPGLRADLIGALIRSLPKSTRRLFVPAAETAEAVATIVDPTQGSLLDALAAELGRRAGTIVDPADFDLGRVPAHLRPTFRVINDRYELLAEGKDLDAVRARLTEEVRATLSAVHADDNDWERSGLRTFDIDSLPRMVMAGEVKAYPALVDEGDAVAIRLLPTEDEQLDAHWLGTRRLLRLNVAGPVRLFDDRLPTSTKLRLVNGPVQSKAEWYNDAIDAAVDDVIAEHGGPPWSKAGFEGLLRTTRAELPDRLETIAGAVITMVDILGQVHTKLDRLTGPGYALSVDDVRAHVARLAYPGFLTGVGLHRVDDVVRYLAGIDRRLDNLTKNPTRDQELVAVCRRLDSELAELVARRGPGPEVEELIWMMEELRVSLFAQGLGTKGRVSEKRVRRELARARSPVAAQVRT
ncbi:MAG: ATP-dependent RNA helicase HrpA [Acidimicrobiales bacterium]